jgi:hypothetical protein
MFFKPVLFFSVTYTLCCETRMNPEATIFFIYIHEVMIFDY